MNSKLPIIVGILITLLLLLTQSVFTVHQTQVAIVLQMGRPVGDFGPGLHFKLPIIQNVILLDARILEYDAKSAEVLTSDKKNLVVDNYTKYRITNPLQFYKTLKNIGRAQEKLNEIIKSKIRVALGNYTLTQIVSQERSHIMVDVTSSASKQLQEFGIEVLDVRIKRTDLPAQNEKAIYNRMRAEREQQAKQYRSEGQEESSKIRSTADKERTVLLAEARREAEVLRGEGDAKATAIYASSLGQDPEFYSFKRSLEAYVKSFKDNSKLVLTPDNRFLRYMQ